MYFLCFIVKVGRQFVYVSAQIIQFVYFGVVMVDAFLQLQLNNNNNNNKNK